MPELPEVETIVRGLARHVVNRCIRNVKFLWPRLVIGNMDETTAQLRGQCVTDLRRYGKYIVFDLERKCRRSYLVVHLRMTGNFIVGGESGPHTRAILNFDNGPVLVYHDIRKFGRWQWSAKLPGRLAELGPEPLDISKTDFKACLRARRGMIKATLLNQEFLRGLGNIYADEVLFRARIHPKTNCIRIGRIRATRLHRAIQEVLVDAIAQGGSTINNYVNSAGVQGRFQLRTKVYGKTGQPCKVCTATICRTVVASRSTHFCPHCQRF